MLPRSNNLSTSYRERRIGYTITTKSHNMVSKRTVLITGCSEGGLGDALAQAFHKTGTFRVFATARSPAKISHLAALGIETLTLDISLPESIANCVSTISALTDGVLDMLVNNAGTAYTAPLLDTDIGLLREYFDLNVAAPIAVTQAFIPLLRASARAGRYPLLVNQTSYASVMAVPGYGPYCGAKSALAIMTDVLRTELEPFGIGVTELRTGGVKTLLANNMAGGVISPTSLYAPVKEKLENVYWEPTREGKAMDATLWAKQVVQDLGGAKGGQRKRVWKGQGVMLARLSWMGLVPEWFLDGALKDVSGMKDLKAIMQKQEK
jgi:1-acylglycerone phosphate reductase